MAGHYLRVQEAAALLGVSGATIRWYSLQGWLPTYRVGRGRVSHRRFRYTDVQAVARRTGRFLADEPRWDPTVPITLEMAAQYLGLSARYLVEAGWWLSGAVMPWEQLTALEQQIYPAAEGPGAPDPIAQKDGGIPMMQMMMDRRCGCGKHAEGGGRGTTSPGWPAADRPPDDANLMALRRAKRHLEARRADLEDEIAELEQRIRLHPDNHDPL